jgi:hypothetical protein
MPLNTMMMSTLKTIGEASAIDGWAYANAKSPPIRALVKEGFLEGNTDQVDPANADRIAFRLTAKGHTEIGTPVDNAGNPPVAGTTVTDTGLTPIPPNVQVQRVAAGKSGRKVGVPNVVPTIVRVSARMAALPVVTDGRTAPGGGRGESYPFASLQAPEVPATATTAASGFDYFFVANRAPSPASGDVPADPGMPNAYKTVKAAVSSANKRYEKKTPPVHFVARPYRYEGVDGAAVFRDK